MKPKTASYFLLTCILLGVTIPVFLLNSVKSGKMPVDISVKSIKGAFDGNDKNRKIEQPSTNGGNTTANNPTPDPTNSPDNKPTENTEITKNDQSTPSQSIPITQSTNTNTNGTIPTNTAMQTTANAVTNCSDSYGSVNFRVSPSIDYTTRDEYGNDSQVLEPLPCNVPITINFDRVVSNSDGVWYVATYQNRIGWINEVCFTMIKNVL